MGSHTLYVISRILESSAVECGFTSLPSRAVACAWSCASLPSLELCMELCLSLSVSLFCRVVFAAATAHW